MKKTISFMLALEFGLTMGALAQAATITIGPGAGYDFNAIQAGIDAAVDGDTVLVAPGEYVITEPVTFRGKAITVQSEVGREETTIRMDTPADANRGSVVIFENNETATSILDGFTITGGIGLRLWIPEKSEFDWIGGGIAFNASSGTVRNCAIVQNKPKYSGGGVVAPFGSSLNLVNCLVAGNTAAYGGGIACSYGSTVTMTDCIVRDNSVGNDGGGLICVFDNASLVMNNCYIAKNYSGGVGGGVSCLHNASVTMTHCAIAGNTGYNGAAGILIYDQSPATVSNCTIARNRAFAVGGGGVWCGKSSATVTNSIIWGNTAPTGREISLGTGAIFSISYSNVDGGQTGVNVGASTLNWDLGNIDADPYFVDPTNDDFHLKSQAGRWNPESQAWVQDDVTSPCIDAGDPMSPIDWELFPNGGFVNMGAYGGTSEASKTYFGGPICETIIAGDINGDGQVNLVDLEIMALHWTDDEPLTLP
jgi:hypothetical protein